MIIGVGLDQRLGLSIGEYAALSSQAIDHGFESIWTNSMTVPDAFHVCSAWSSQTQTLTGHPIRTGIAVIPAPKSWHLESLANQAATVGQIAHGNFVLGIGTGGAGKDFWASAGLPNRPISIMRDYVTILRRLFAGDDVNYEGNALALHHTKLAQEIPGVPVYLAALGPQMLELAGEVADGVCLNWATPDQIAWSDGHLRTGITKAGRRREDLKMSMYVRVCIDEDVVAARGALCTQVLTYGLSRPGVDRSLSYRGHFARMGFDDLFIDLERRRESGASLSELIDFVPDELLNMVGYFGTPDGAPARFAELSLGLDESIVRIISARKGIRPIVDAMNALTPAKIRAQFA
ncbi:MAG TPA: LLM class flavin-dependent oxidoreductase [Acidimicrobiales bacterium]|nr:LLM class flavin-dependent oxidoreductase [Acidimicrobiales bacterium]